MINILLIDDHVLFREGLVTMLSAQPDMRIAGEGGSVAEAIALNKSLHPDLVLMDYSLSNGTGVEALRAILIDWPSTRVVFLTMHEDPHLMLNAISNGAKGYILKYEQLSMLLSYIRGVAHGEAVISPKLTSRLFDEISHKRPAAEDSLKVFDLSAREVEILNQIATGASNREIANQLVIAQNTVRKHVSNILHKLNLKTRRDAMKLVQTQRINPS